MMQLLHRANSSNGDRNPIALIDPNNSRQYQQQHQQQRGEHLIVVKECQRPGQQTALFRTSSSTQKHYKPRSTVFEQSPLKQQAAHAGEQYSPNTRKLQQPQEQRRLLLRRNQHDYAKEEGDDIDDECDPTELDMTETEHMLSSSQEEEGEGSFGSWSPPIGRVQPVFEPLRESSSPKKEGKGQQQKQQEAKHIGQQKQHSSSTSLALCSSSSSSLLPLEELIMRLQSVTAQQEPRDIATVHDDDDDDVRRNNENKPSHSRQKKQYQQQQDDVIMSVEEMTRILHDINQTEAANPILLSSLFSSTNPVAKQHHHSLKKHDSGSPPSMVSVFSSKQSLAHTNSGSSVSISLHGLQQHLEYMAAHHHGHHHQDDDGFTLEACSTSCDSSVTWFEGSQVEEIEVTSDDADLDDDVDAIFGQGHEGEIISFPNSDCVDFDVISSTSTPFIEDNNWEWNADRAGGKSQPDANAASSSIPAPAMIKNAANHHRFETTTVMVDYVPEKPERVASAVQERSEKLAAADVVMVVPNRHRSNDCHKIMEAPSVRKAADIKQDNYEEEKQPSYHDEEEEQHQRGQPLSSSVASPEKFRITLHLSSYQLDDWYMRFI